MPTFHLDGKVAIVTGASRGLGAEIARGFVEHGASVVLSSRKQADLDAVAAGLDRIRPGSAIAVAAHAGRPDDLRQLVDTTMERFGRIDILVNNAGTNPYFGSMIDAELAAWDKTFEVNLRGYFALTQLCYRASMEANGGAVLNIASTGGIRPSRGLGVYGVSKAGVIMLTRQLASELEGKVRVNCIAPGLFKTRFAEALWSNQEIVRRVLEDNPMGRIGDPSEIAGPAVFLCSYAASYVNGQVLVLDGGGSAPA
jgi:NAD(P)-dependent dehydrogenase (short-subunit alcohol dehydrogenase family)